MILLAHLIFGALIGQKISNPFLAVILAFLGHYFLDVLPHTEYSIENIEKKQWRRALPDALRVVLDFCLGILLISLFSKNQPIIYMCAFAAVLPDGFTLLNRLLPNKASEAHGKFHQKTHFLKHKKISVFWRVASQVVVVLICVIFLKT